MSTSGSRRNADVLAVLAVVLDTARSVFRRPERTDFKMSTTSDGVPVPGSTGSAPGGGLRLPDDGSVSLLGGVSSRDFSPSVVTTAVGWNILLATGVEASDWSRLVVEVNSDWSTDDNDDESLSGGCW